MLSRVLPGSVVVVAALTLPELSVGAGDFVESAGGTGARTDPPRPLPIKERPDARLASAPVKSVLTGVRYAPIIDLGPDFERDPIPEAVSSAPLIAPRPSVMEPAALSGRVPDVPAPSLPEPESAETELAPGLVSPTSGLGTEFSVAEAMPRPSEPLAPPAVEIAAVPPQALLPAGLAAPSDAAQVVPASVAAAPQAVPAGRGVIEQLAPAALAPVAEVQPVSRPAPATLAAAPVATKPPVAATPGTRAPSQPTATAAKPAAPPPAAAAVVPAPKPALAAPASAASSRYQFDVKSQLVTRVDGKTAGAVDFQQTPVGLTVRLGSIVEVLADRYDAAQLARIRGSAAGNAYVSLTDLQAQGIPISYDPIYDEFNVGLTDTRPKAALKVHMDQISTPERGLGSTGMEQVRR